MTETSTLSRHPQPRQQGPHSQQSMTLQRQGVAYPQYERGVQQQTNQQYREGYLQNVSTQKSVHFDSPAMKKVKFSLYLYQTKNTKKQRKDGICIGLTSGFGWLVERENRWACLWLLSSHPSVEHLIDVSFTCTVTSVDLTDLIHTQSKGFWHEEITEKKGRMYFLSAILTTRSKEDIFSHFTNLNMSVNTDTPV